MILPNKLFINVTYSLRLLEIIPLSLYFTIKQTNMKRLTKLITALDYLKNNEQLELGNDTFLTGYLDGSEKIYGWLRYDGNLYVISRDGEYPIEQMGKEDIKYIFSLSNIYEKILLKKYEIVDNFLGFD